MPIDTFVIVPTYNEADNLDDLLSQLLALPVHLGAVDFAQTEALITKLMGKGEAAARRELMELHGDAVDIDI